MLKMLFKKYQTDEFGIGSRIGNNVCLPIKLSGKVMD